MHPFLQGNKALQASGSGMLEVLDALSLEAKWDTCFLESVLAVWYAPWLV